MRHFRFPVWALLLLPGTTGLAATIVQTQSVELLNVGNSFAVPVMFDEFDPALGSLTSITLGLQASLSGTVGIENVSNAPDVAEGVIGGSVTVADNGDTFAAEVFPSADGPTHHLAAFDGTLDYAGASGATDSVFGAPVSTSSTAPPPASVLGLFSGAGQIFLALTATSFPVAEGMQTEDVTETSNAAATAQLTYSYTPASTVPEPGSMAMLIAALACAAMPWAGGQAFSLLGLFLERGRCGRVRR